LFQKELTTSAEMLHQWQYTLNLLKAFNPLLKVFFTVSPVRHIKDGIIENNHSKSILIQLVHDLVKQENCFYFPSYEIVIDELRDYRYFKEDLVHPSEQAIQYIWEKLSKSLFTVQTDVIAKTYLSIKRSEHHLALHPESEESIKFQEQLVLRKKEFLEKNPNLKF
jgi:nucleoid-associated protein YejK